MPVFKHWKDYNDPNGNVRDGIFRNFVGKVGGISQINKANRSQIKFPQTTGARSYAVHCGNITEMEKKASNPTEDGQESSSATEAATGTVDDEVLAKHTKKPGFLQHVGIQHVHARSSAINREVELAVEKMNVELWARVDTLTKQFKEFVEERARQDEEYRKRDEYNRKKQDEMDVKLDLLLSQMPSRSAEG
ncbi:hypothetical protein D1007_38382 [Hordeum vulgare]|nr:hypothetical protein D1007_38382 [Hordeum vulgare]